MTISILREVAKAQPRANKANSIEMTMTVLRRPRRSESGPVSSAPNIAPRSVAEVTTDCIKALSAMAKSSRRKSKALAIMPVS